MLSYASNIDTLSYTKLQEAVVVADRYRREIIPVQALQGKALQRVNAYTVADAVRYFSGVQIKDYGGIGGLKTINVRSMGSHHVGVFYDGIEVGNAQNGVVDLGRFSLDNMESVAVYNGQKSAIFQPAKDFSSASALYMRTKRPSFTADKRYNLNMGVKSGSFGTINPSLLYEYNINNNLTLSLSGEYMYTTGRYKFSYSTKGGYDTTEVRKNGDVEYMRAEAALFGKMQKGDWMVKSYFYKSERGYPGASVREEPGKFKHQDRQWDDNLFIQGYYKQSISKWYRLMVNAKFAYDYLHYLSDPRLDVTTMFVDNRYRQKEGYISLANLFTPLEWLSFSYSTDFMVNGLSADLVDFVYPTRYSLLNSGALFLDFKKLKVQSSLLHTYINDKIKKIGAAAGDKSVFSPSVVLSYRPFNGENLNFRGFYKKVFRMPTFNDLYYTFIGNKNLKPEFTTQYNLGATYSKPFLGILSNIEVQTDFYFNTVENKIIAMPTSNQFRWTMLNLGYVEIRGVDVGVTTNWNIKKVTLMGRLNYTYQKAQDFTDSSSPWYGGQIPYVPWHSGSLILGGEYGSWGLNYSFIYTGERYEAVANIKENYAQPWYTHDMAITKSFNYRGVEIKGALEVNNIFNQQYEVVQCYPMPGTNFKIKLNVIL